MSYRKAVGGAYRVAAIAILIVLASASSAFAATNGGLGSTDLSQGMTGTAVKTLQKDLTAAGDKIAASGTFGHFTTVKVEDFQSQQKLSVDGVVGPETKSTLLKVLGAKASGSGASATSASASGGAGFVPPASNAAFVRWTLVSGVPVATKPGTPQAIINVIDAGDRIAFKRYIYGGGHTYYTNGKNGQTALASGYDCSGSVSFALHADGTKTSMLKEPLDSSEFMDWGAKGKGKWITVYANSGHAYAMIAGLRFDTVAQQDSVSRLHPFGDRWTTQNLGSDGYAAGAFVVRHPAGW